MSCGLDKIFLLIVQNVINILRFKVVYICLLPLDRKVPSHFLYAERRNLAFFVAPHHLNLPWEAVQLGYTKKMRNYVVQSFHNP